MIRRLLLLIPAVTVLSLLGCQHAADHPWSARYLPPAGALFVLREPVVVPSRSAHVFIQNAQAIGGKGEFYPGCTLEVQEVGKGPQVIDPDEFVITKLEQYQNCVVLTSTNELATTGTDVDVLFAGSGGLSDCWYVTRMWLRSQGQPQVRLLECQKLDDPAIGRYLSLDDIRRTLSPVGDFVGPDGTALPPIGSPEH